MKVALDDVAQIAADDVEDYVVKNDINFDDNDDDDESWFLPRKLLFFKVKQFKICFLKIFLKSNTFNLISIRVSVRKFYLNCSVKHVGNKKLIVAEQKVPCNNLKFLILFGHL